MTLKCQFNNDFSVCDVYIYLMLLIQFYMQSLSCTAYETGRHLVRCIVRCM